MTSSWKLTLAVLVLPFIAAQPLCAATYGTNSFADAFVTTGTGGTLVSSNYGGGGALSLAAGALSKGEFQTVLRFDLAGAKNSFDSQYGVGQWTIQSISLQLASAAPNNAIFNASSVGQFGVSWMQNKSWVEGSGTPAAPGASGLNYTSLTNSFLSSSDQGLGTFSFGGGTSGLNSYTLTLSSSLAADILAGDTVSLRLFAADSTVSYLFNAREFGNTANRPLFTVTAIPEPTSVLLGALALGSFAWQRRSPSQPKP